MIRHLFITAIALATSIATLHAGDSTVVTARVLLDAAYSRSFNTPPNHERTFTLQPSRNDQFGIMQGIAGVELRSAHVRGKVAAQTGWFADVLWTGADTSLRWLSEAWLGVRLTEGVWLDAGVYPSHIGAESMIARDNLVLSRMYVSDATPYAETGVSITWEESASTTIALHVLNGWQRIIDNNDGIAIGTRIAHRPSDALSLTWGTFVGDERPRGQEQQLRWYSNAWMSWNISNATTLIAIADVGTQERRIRGYDVVWYLGAIAAVRISPALRLAARLEHMNDRHNVLIPTPTQQPFISTSASINADYTVGESMLLRAEGRILQAPYAMFPSRTGLRMQDAFVTLSASYAFQLPITALYTASSYQRRSGNP